MDVIKKLVDKSFLFDFQPASDWNSLIPFIAVFAGLIILGIASIIVFNNLNPALAKIKKGINSWLISLGILGLFITFFRWQELSFLSKNFVLELVGIIWLVWIVIMLVYVIFKYPDEKYQIAERKRIDKYVPRPKKKRKK